MRYCFRAFVQRIGVAALIISSLSLTGCISRTDPPPPSPHTTTTKKTTPAPSLSILLAPGITYLPATGGVITPVFDTSGTTATTLLTDHPYDIVANAGYFDYTDEARTAYRHAGGLVIDGIRHSAFATRDALVTHALLRASGSTDYAIIPNSIFDTSMIVSGTHLVQAGPLILSGGTLMTELLATSTNNTNAYPRTTIALADGKLAGIILSISPISLVTLGEVVRDHEVFAGQAIDLLNLDGGRSTAAAATDGYTRRAQHTLPAWFGIRRTNT